MTVNARANRLAETAETLVKVNAMPTSRSVRTGRASSHRARSPIPPACSASSSRRSRSASGVGTLDASRSPRWSRSSTAGRQHGGRRRDGSAESPRKIAPALTPDRKTVILGGGPNYATAYFGMAKWHEALTRPCHVVGTRGMGARGIFHHARARRHLHPPAAGRRPSRGLEQASAAREMGSRVIVIGAEDDADARPPPTSISPCRPTFPNR